MLAESSPIVIGCEPIVIGCEMPGASVIVGALTDANHSPSRTTLVTRLRSRRDRVIRMTRLASGRATEHGVVGQS